MSDRKITDRDYLFLSSMLKARESRMLTRDRLEQMLSGTAAEAAKVLSESGWPDMAGMNPEEIDKALSARRVEMLRELSLFIPEKEVTDFFRLKYDYHNAKSIVKGEGAGVSTDKLLSGAGRVEPEKLLEAFTEDNFRFVPGLLGKAMDEAKRTLAQTGNPQLCDFVLDKAYFAEMETLAKSVSDPFLDGYRQTLTDCANLRTAVRCLRMGRDLEFLRSALIPGGTVSPERLAQDAFAGEGVGGVFASTPFRDAAALGAEAVRGGAMTAFERECDNTVNRFLTSARTTGFGLPLVAGYLAAEENNIAAVRMVLTGLLAGIDPQRLKERLRDTYA